MTDLTNVNFSPKALAKLALALLVVIVIAMLMYGIAKTWVLPLINRVPGAAKVTGGAGSSQGSDEHPAMEGL